MFWFVHSEIIALVLSHDFLPGKLYPRGVTPYIVYCTDVQLE